MQLVSRTQMHSGSRDALPARSRMLPSAADGAVRSGSYRGLVDSCLNREDSRHEPSDPHGQHPQCFAASRQFGGGCRHSDRGGPHGRPVVWGEAAVDPQHNLVLATRGSTQFFLKIYELALQASFRADFTIEQLMAELGLVIDQLWPNYERAAAEAGLPIERLGTELILGGWSPKNA